MQYILSKVQINRIVKCVDFKGCEQKRLPVKRNLPPVLLPCLYYHFVS